MRFLRFIALALAFCAVFALYERHDTNTATANGGQVPPGHTYVTYYVTEQGPGYESTVYVDESFPDAKGVPLLVAKSWIRGFDPLFQGKPFCPMSQDEAQHWWGDRDLDLAVHWSYSESGGDKRWTYNGPKQRLTARFGIMNVDQGDLIGGEFAARSSATVRCISPITGNAQVVPPPPDVNTDGNQEPTNNCPKNTDEVSAVFDGYLPASSFTGPHSDGGFVYNGKKVSFNVAPGITIVSPDGTFTAGQKVPETTVFTFYCG